MTKLTFEVYQKLLIKLILILLGPVGNGVVTCASIYSSDFHGDYGNGPGAAIWIDNLGILQ